MAGSSRKKQPLKVYVPPSRRAVPVPELPLSETSKETLDCSSGCVPNSGNCVREAVVEKSAKKPVEIKRSYKVAEGSGDTIPRKEVPAPQSSLGAEVLRHGRANVDEEGKERLAGECTSGEPSELISNGAEGGGEFIDWLEQIVVAAGMQQIIASYALGLLEIGANESEDELKAGLLEFFSAMLSPETSAQLEGSPSPPPPALALRLVEEIWQGWVKHGGAEGGLSREQMQDEGREAGEQGFDGWLDDVALKLGLEQDVHVPYIKGLVAEDSSGEALADFLRDLVRETKSDQDPTALAAEITARSRAAPDRPMRAPDLSCSSSETEPANKPLSRGRQKGRKTKQQSLNLELFAHWWVQPDRSAVVEKDTWEQLDSHGSVSKWDGDYFQKDDWMLAKSQQSAPKGRIGVSRCFSGLNRPATSSVVARRIILHILGLRGSKKPS